MDAEDAERKWFGVNNEEISGAWDGAGSQPLETGAPGAAL